LYVLKIDGAVLMKMLMRRECEDEDLTFYEGDDISSSLE